MVDINFDNFIGKMENIKNIIIKRKKVNSIIRVFAFYFN